MFLGDSIYHLHHHLGHFCTLCVPTRPFLEHLLTAPMLNFFECPPGDENPTLFTFLNLLAQLLSSYGQGIILAKNERYSWQERLWIREGK
jgi:hypothetical protein